MYWTLSWIDSIETISVSWPAARQSVCIAWRIQISNRLWKKSQCFSLNWKINSRMEQKNPSDKLCIVETIHTTSWGFKCFPQKTSKRWVRSCFNVLDSHHLLKGINDRRKHWRWGFGKQPKRLFAVSICWLFPNDFHSISTMIMFWWENRFRFSMTENDCLMNRITSSTARGRGGSFKNRKPIGKIHCCKSQMTGQNHWWIELSNCLPDSLTSWPTVLLTYWLVTSWSKCLIGVGWNFQSYWEAA